MTSEKSAGSTPMSSFTWNNQPALLAFTCAYLVGTRHALFSLVCIAPSLFTRSYAFDLRSTYSYKLYCVLLEYKSNNPEVVRFANDREGKLIQSHMKGFL